MQTGTISFCDNHALNIKSNTIKTNILELLEKEYGIKILSKHYDKFDGEKTISKLRQNPYLVSLKSNGNPYFMYCTKYNNVNMTMLIDKKIQHGYFLPRIIIVRKGFDSSIYSNTLFEGEMIKTSDKEWVYVVNDILVYKKNRLTSMNILKRLNLINDILENMYKRYPQDIFHIQIKKYVKCSELESKLLLMRDGLNYTNRGLLFKPMFTKFRDILLNFDDSLIDNTKKIKYLDVKDNKYIDINDFKTNHNQCEPNTKPDVNYNIHNDKVFNVLKTDMPDIYELYDDDDKRLG